MPNLDLFMDSSALLAGLISSQGAARALLLLSEDKMIKLVVSEQVIVEVERNLARKAPNLLKISREMIRYSSLTITRDPKMEEVISHLDWISHHADVPILVAAVKARVNFLVTLNSRHFIDDPQVSQKSGLRIGTPGDAIVWVRNQLNYSKQQD